MARIESFVHEVLKNCPPACRNKRLRITISEGNLLGWYVLLSWHHSQLEFDLFRPKGWNAEAACFSVRSPLPHDEPGALLLSQFKFEWGAVGISYDASPDDGY